MLGGALHPPSQPAPGVWYSSRSFIPGAKIVKGDRAFLVEAAHAIYVECMNECLFRRVRRHPTLTDDRVRNVVVHEMNPRRWKTAFALFVGTGWLVSFQDYTNFRGVGAHGTDVRMSGRNEDRTKLLVSYD